MPAKLVCPECESVLNPAKPVPDGKKVRCPRCGAGFVAPGLSKEKAGGTSSKRDRPAPAQKSNGVKKASAEPPPPEKAAPKKAASVDDSGEGGAYGFAHEEEQEKPAISYAPDTSIKDLRGPAQAAVIVPSNGLLFAACISALLAVINVMVALWPFVFSDELVSFQAVMEQHSKTPQAESEMEAIVKAERPTEPPGVIRDEARKRLAAMVNNLPRDRQQLSDEQKQIVQYYSDREFEGRVWWMSLAILVFIYNLVLAQAAVKMQNLESYGWALTAAIMAMVPFNLIGLILLAMYEVPITMWALIGFTVSSLAFGIWSMVVLNQERVVAGYHYAPE